MLSLCKIDQDSKKAEIELNAKVGELEIQVPGVETDACKFMSCPIKKGDTKTLKYTLTIPSIAPTVSSNIILVTKFMTINPLPNEWGTGSQIKHYLN